MLDNVPIFPERAAEIAYRVDAFLFFMLLVTGSVAIGVYILVIYFSVRYRRRPAGIPVPTPRIAGSTPLELLWTGIAFLIFLVMFGWGASIYFTMVQPPANAIDVYVVGKQWMWKIQHAQGQREINQLHVPLGQPVKLTLASEDVIHDFFVPAFRTKVDVVPGRYVYTWFTPTVAGQYHFFFLQDFRADHPSLPPY